MFNVVLREVQQAVEHHISILIQIASLVGGIHDGFQVIGGGGGVHVFYRLDAKDLEDGIGRVLKEVDEPAENPQVDLRGCGQPARRLHGGGDGVVLGEKLREEHGCNRGDEKCRDGAHGDRHRGRNTDAAE